MKAKDVRGFMIEKESIGLPWGHANTLAGHGYVNGYNKAINNQVEKEITLNREKLAIAIYNEHQPYLVMRQSYKIADAIIAAEADILESPKKDNK